MAEGEQDRDFSAALALASRKILATSLLLLSILPTAILNRAHTPLKAHFDPELLRLVHGRVHREPAIGRRGNDRRIRGRVDGTGVGLRNGSEANDDTEG